MPWRTAVTSAFLIFTLIHIPSTNSEEVPEPLFKNSAQKVKAVIQEVVTTDTVILNTVNDERIILIGIKALDPPKKEHIMKDQFGFEIKDKVRPETSLEERALDFAKELLEGKTVRLEYDVQKKNESYRTMAYIFLPDGTLANAELLRHGYAQLKLRPPNMKYADQLRQAYREAREEKRGIQGN